MPEQREIKYRTINRKTKDGVEWQETVRELDTKIFTDISSKDLVDNFHASTYRPDKHYYTWLHRTQEA